MMFCFMYLNFIFQLNNKILHCQTLYVIASESNPTSFMGKTNYFVQLNIALNYNNLIFQIKKIKCGCKVMFVTRLGSH